MSVFKAAEEIKVDDEIVMRRMSHDYDQQRYNAIVSSLDHLLPWMQWAHFYENSSIDAMVKFADTQIEAFDKGAVLGYDIIYKGEFAGAIDLHDLSAENRRCEIGYWLNKAFTGKGIVTRATEKITEYAFNEIDMHRVVLKAASKNTASCAVAERLNFPFEGVLRDNELLDGEYYDTNVYAKINPRHKH